jgi:hypothetical protein
MCQLRKISRKDFEYMSVSLERLKELQEEARERFHQVEKEAVIFRQQDGTVSEPTLAVLNNISAEHNLLNQLIHEAESTKKK